MRLLHVETFEFHDFNPANTPKYAILSHTWATDEVTYEDVAFNFGPEVQAKAGWRKIRFTCEEALGDKLMYVWVDTCCIDKRSSAELSEAINSMFAWYQQAAVCYVYLADVEFRESGLESLRSARWFTRGWTLQELLAPQALEFFSQEWINIGFVRKLDWDLLQIKEDRDASLPRPEQGDISGTVASVTGIEVEVLKGEVALDSICVARRMSWASSRQTTRPEDISYCLLGIFNINMPTIYGEGEKAFQRLQEEIVKSSDDHSLFAWTLPGTYSHEPYGLLAKSPSYFARSKAVSAFRDWTHANPYSVGNLGLAITLPISKRSITEYAANLNCTWSASARERVCLALRRIPGTADQYQRVRVASQLKASRSTGTVFRSQIYLRQNQVLPSASDVIERRPFQIALPNFGPYGTSKRSLSAFLHTGVAVTQLDWYDELLQQKVSVGLEGLRSTTFHLPGERATLSVILCIETTEEHEDYKSDSDKLPDWSFAGIKGLRNLRKRVNHSDSRWRKFRKNLKGSRSAVGAESSSDGGPLLLLLGTAHDSHQPICLPLAAQPYMETLEKALDSGGESLKLRVGLKDSRRELPLQDGKTICEDLFEELSDSFKSMARAHSIHPDYNIRRDVDDVKLKVHEEGAGQLLECELEITQAVRYELDSTQVLAELDATSIRVRPEAKILEETEDVASTSSNVEHVLPAATGAYRDSFWSLAEGANTDYILHENVFELDEGNGEAIQADIPLAPDSTPIDLTTIGTAL